MRKFHLLMVCFIAILATSCTTTVNVVSKSSLDNTIRSVSQQLSNNGYTMTATSNETKNEVSVTGVTYSRYTGYGSAMRNNYWQYVEYSYSDSLQNQISYAIKYQLNTDMDGKEFVQNLELTNCTASKDYNAICGSNGVVKQKITEIKNNPDMEATIPNPAGSACAIATSTLGVCGIILIVVLLL